MDKSTLARKQELEQSIRVTKMELDEIDTSIRGDRLKPLAGKCFKYHNSYSSPKDDSERWWMYKTITKVDGVNTWAFSFQKDEYNKVEIDFYDVYVPTDGWIEIDRNEFLEAWEHIFSDVVEHWTATWTAINK